MNKKKSKLYFTDDWGGNKIFKCICIYIFSSADEHKNK